MERFAPITQREWGGLNEDENPSALGKDELSECRNASLLGKSIGTRPGVNREGTGADFEDAIVSGAANDVVKGLYHFSKRSDFQRDILMAICGKSIYTDSTTAVPDSLGPPVRSDINSSANNVHCFAQYREHVYLTGYVVNGVGQFSLNWWDGAGNLDAVKIDSGLGAAIPDPKYIIAKWGHLFVAGMDPLTPDNANNTMCVRFNDIGSDATTNAAWPTANTIGTGAIVGSIGGMKEYGGEFITGLAEYQDNEGDWLLILTSHRIVSALRNPSTGTPFVDSAIANGCVHQNAYVNLGLDYGDAVYVSEHGIHSLRQSQEFGGRDDSFLSWKIRRLFETLNPNRIHLTVGGYDQNEGYVLLAVSTGSNTTHDTILCLDVRHDNALTADGAKWYVWHLASDEKIASFAQCRDPSGKMRLYAGGTEGSVGYFSRDEYTDFGTGFSVSWTGKHEDFGAPTVEKALGDIVVDVQPGGDYEPQMTTVFDFGSRQSPVQTLPMPREAARWWDAVEAPGTVWADENGNGGFLWASGAIITARNKLYGQGRGNTVASRFQHTGGDEPFWIASRTLEVSGAAETGGAQGEGS